MPLASCAPDSTFKQATPTTFRHGANMPITRANIAEYVKSQTDDGHPVPDASEIVRAFIRFPKPRHLLRAAGSM